MEQMNNKITLTYGTGTFEVDIDASQWQFICLVYDHIKTELIFHHNGEVRMQP